MIAILAAVPAVAALIAPAADAARSEGSPADPAGSLHAVSVLSRDEAWAVGEKLTKDGAGTVLIQHYDGHGWTSMSARLPTGASSSSLAGVAALAAGNVWAVGATNVEGVDEPLIEHGNGTRWQDVENPPLGSASLAGISGSRPDDVWAVGQAAGRALVEHWDGRHWRVADFPDSGVPRASDRRAGATGSELTSVSAIAPDDVWVAGQSVDGRHSRTLIAHWDGNDWTVVPSPTPGKQKLAHLTGISASGPSDVWAVGDYAAGTALLPLIEHWDGTSWTESEAPHLTGHLRRLTAVTARTADDAWAVGIRGGKTVILHWDGAAWTQAKTPPDDDGSFLAGVDADAADDAWAVGGRADADGFRPLRLHWDGAAWVDMPGAR